MALGRSLAGQGGDVEGCQFLATRLLELLLLCGACATYFLLLLLLSVWYISADPLSSME